MTRKRRQNGLYRRNGIFNFRYKSAEGVWREKSTGTADRDEAVGFKKQWDEDLRNDQLPTDKAEWTVAQACTLFVDTHKLEARAQRAMSDLCCGRSLESSVRRS